MSARFRSKVLAAAAAVTVTGGLALAGALTVTSASATTLTCTQVKAVYVTPYGCGGLRFAYSAKGILDMTADGNYWDAPVRVQPESVMNTGQDWTVFALDGLTTGGEDDLGADVAMFTPGGVIPGGCAGGQPCSASNPVVAPSPADFCLSVENVIRTVRGHRTERWPAVLRNCFTGTGDGQPEFTLGIAPNGINSVTDPNLYQLWSPALATSQNPSPVYLVNEALLQASFRHDLGSNARYVLDDTALGGAGTQLIAFPANGGQNQQEVVLGCTPPVTLTGLDQLCP